MEFNVEKIITICDEMMSDDKKKLYYMNEKLIKEMEKDYPKFLDSLKFKHLKMKLLEYLPSNLIRKNSGKLFIIGVLFLICYSLFPGIFYWRMFNNPIGEFIVEFLYNTSLPIGIISLILVFLVFVLYIFGYYDFLDDRIYKLKYQVENPQKIYEKLYMERVEKLSDQYLQYQDEIIKDAGINPHLFPRLDYNYQKIKSILETGKITSEEQLVRVGGYSEDIILYLLRDPRVKDYNTISKVIDNQMVYEVRDLMKKYPKKDVSEIINMAILDRVYDKKESDQQENRKRSSRWEI